MTTEAGLPIHAVDSLAFIAEACCSGEHGLQ
jgi:hypothetical protein